MNYGLIASDGTMPNSDFQYFGSGSGGSIQIFTLFLFGSGNVTAKGGDAFLGSVGGEGGGGRIKINFSEWQYETSFNYNLELF